MAAQPPVDVMRRLTFAKYIYTLGILESRRRSPLNAASLLMFHDAAELFLQIASEQLDIGKNQPNFLEYWDLLSSRMTEPVSQKEAMRRLNKARVALKHSGTTPSPDDIASFRETITRFFEENTPRLFGLAFAQLTLVEFVEPASARERLRNASNAVVQNQLTNDAFADVALAFDDIIGLREREISPGPFPIFPFGREFPGNPFAFRFSREVDQGVAQSLSALAEAVGLLQRTCKLLIMGVDFTGLLRFESFTPEITRTANGNYQARLRQPIDRMDVEDLDFCVQFAVETALTLQQGTKPWQKLAGA